ncbi:hypothetical protein ACCQ07_22330 (plasmid) [Xanthomonas sp. NCPPB 3583]|uniref:hypothetical protein n=1 Tax=Xanthomonas sp. NCPPB 3583 TaxID=487558 RepID=UPI003558B153
MKLKAHLALLPLTLVAGMALAHDPPKTADQEDKVDHSKMDMSGKQADHKKMAADEFAALDKNKDGKLTKAELPKDSPVRPHFEMLDADKDGSLSSAEFAGHHGM